MLDLLRDYVNKRIDLLKLEATEKSSEVIGIITFVCIVAMFGIFFIIMFNIGLGLLIGHYLGSYAYGILVMAAFYLVLILIVYLSRDKIKHGIADNIIKILNK